MRSKGFTLIELLVVIALLGVILAALTSIYVSALKNNQMSFAKSGFQKDLNFTIDDLNKNIKQASGVLPAYGGDSLSTTTLIITLPAIDANGSFLYTNGGLTLLTDTFVYTLSGTSLHKKIFAVASSVRYPQNNSDKIIATNVSRLYFSYYPTQVAPENIKTEIDISKVIEKTTVKVTGTTTAFMRNNR
jgi:prepilin-type N-terminal cleavage/methylation domain-containing protein